MGFRVLSLGSFATWRVDASFWVQALVESPSAKFGPSSVSDVASNPLTLNP